MQHNTHLLTREQKQAVIADFINTARTDPNNFFHHFTVIVDSFELSLKPDALDGLVDSGYECIQAMTALADHLQEHYKDPVGSIVVNDMAHEAATALNDVSDLFEAKVQPPTKSRVN
jgi:hypothetical protein